MGGDPMPFWKWSHTASANANADSTVNWAEGMAPSAVNDSARAIMARLAEWRDDVSGALVTSGTSTAYTVTSNQGFDNFADMNGAMIASVVHATNGAGPVTLNADGLGAKALRSAPGVELPSGVLVQGTPYVVTYNNSDGAFYLQGFTVNPYVIPIGGLLDYCGTSAPNSSFVLPAGQAISRTTYATLFSLVGITFGSGDGSTTFNVPDLRGRVVAGLDNLNGAAAGRIGTSLVTDSGTINGESLGSTGGSSTHVQTMSELTQHTHTDSGHTHTVSAEQKDISSIQAPSSGGFLIPTLQAENYITSTGNANIQATGSSRRWRGFNPPSCLAKFFALLEKVNLLRQRSCRCRIRGHLCKNHQQRAVVEVQMGPQHSKADTIEEFKHFAYRKVAHVIPRVGARHDRNAGRPVEIVDREMQDRGARGREHAVHFGNRLLVVWDVLDRVTRHNAGDGIVAKR
jgi:microcystin-dependent protein